LNGCTEQGASSPWRKVVRRAGLENWLKEGVAGGRDFLTEWSKKNSKYWSNK